MTVSDLRYRLEDLADDEEVKVSVTTYTYESTIRLSAALIIGCSPEVIILKIG